MTSTSFRTCDGTFHDLEDRNDQSGTERELREALRLKPDNSTAFRRLGKSLARLERLDEAREIYLKSAGVTCDRGDPQTEHEIEVFLKRLEKVEN